MAIRRVKPTSPGRRFQAYSSFEEITKTKPEKRLLKALKKSGGRNAKGRITSRHRGGGHKRHYRVIDFKRDKIGIPAKVASIEYDPNRTANIALVQYEDGEKRYILHVLKVDILLQHDKTEDVRNISVGHNSIAAISYVALFVIALVQVFTGFGLYADNSGWWLPKLFAWVVPLFGGDFMVRTIHHVATWFFILFTLIHVYLVFYHDWLEGRGEVSSMFGGYKFVCEERLAHEDLEEMVEEVPPVDKTPVETSPSS